jgi:asparagine synthase (glutamine-hydrolysing)
MCGIAGIVGPSGGKRDVAVAAGRAMAATIAHRGPDASGEYDWDRGPVVLTHRRLSIIDLSAEGSQPMRSRSGRWVIAYNGEIYNHRTLRAELEGAGSVFRGHSDTEVLVEAIDAWGLDRALERCNGMFAFAALDLANERLTIARDRLGEKPLYWMNDRGRFAFSSELRALRVLPGVDLEIDPAAATALLRWSFIPHPHTIYSGVQQLGPGALLEVELGPERPQVTQRRWWSLAEAIDEAIDARTDTTLGAAVDELEPLLADAVGSRLDSDVPLGVFLSGGIDSSVVAAFAQQADPARAVRTFTVSMPDIGFDESVHASTVARHLGTDHLTVELSVAEALAQIPGLPQIWDEPFADPSMLPSALLCRAAREHLTVCLGGDGGDELFAGYNRHVFGAAIDRRLMRLPTSVRRGLGAAALLPPPGLVDRVGGLLPQRWQLPNLGDKVQKAGALMTSDGSTWETLAGVWPAGDLRVAAHPASIPAVTGELDGVERMMLADTAAVLPDQMLVKVDRASMASSLEVRVPLLDHRLLEWAWRQPTSVKTDGRTGKLVLRRLADRMLPPEIVDRPKMGFDPPLGRWLRNELRPWTQDLLASPRCVEEGWVSAQAIRSTFDEHVSGRRNWDYRLWGVLMLEAWLAEHQSK